MSVTLKYTDARGREVTVTGEPEDVAIVAKEAGAKNVTYYESGSRGTVAIQSMATPHIVNALNVLWREWLRERCAGHVVSVKEYTARIGRGPVEDSWTRRKEFANLLTELITNRMDE